MKQRTRLVNQLHEQLCIAYPSYKSFFNDISRPTALYFWEHYPSRKYLRGKSVEDLRKELVPVSHNKCSTKTCEKILAARLQLFPVQMSLQQLRFLQRLVISNVLVMPINWHSSQGLHHFIYPPAVRGRM